MRILYLCGDHGIPAFGRKGASTHLREMIAALREEGHEVMLAAVDLSGDRRPEENFQTVKLPASRSKLLGHDGRYLVASWKARGVLERAARSFRPDAIYERSALYFTAGEWLARRHRLPRILEVNTLLAEEQETRLHFPAWAERTEHGLLRGADGIAAISEVMADRLAEMGVARDRVQVFPMAVNPARFSPCSGPNAIRERLGWGPEVKVLGYVGSMNSYHRPNWYVDLAEKLLRRGDQPVRFLIVGGVPSKIHRYQGRLVRWVEEGLVHFAGSVPQEDMRQWLCAMDVVLVAGAAPQSTPTKIFEAAAVGRPLILPDTEPIRRLCAGGAEDLLFEQNNFRIFEKRVLEWLGGASGVAEASRFLRTKVVEEYTWQGHAKRVGTWLEQLRPR